MDDVHDPMRTLVGDSSGEPAGSPAPLNGGVPPYAQALDALPIRAFAATPSGDYTYVSREWCAFTGLSVAQALGTGYRRIIEPADAERVAAAWSAACASCQPYGDEFRIRRRGGACRWVRTDAAPVRDPVTGAVTAWFGTLRDIDERPRGSDELRASEALYRTISQALPGVTWMASPAGDLTFIDDRWPDVREEPREYGLGDVWLQRVHPDDRERVRAAWSQAVRTGAAYKIKFRIRIAGGSYHWFLVRALPVRNADGSIVRWVGVNIDVDDQHAADEAREMYAALVENSTDFIGIAGQDGKMAYVNSAGRELLGIGSLQSACAVPFIDYFLEADRPFVQAQIFAAVESSGSWTGDFSFRHFCSGAPVPVGVNLFAISRADGSRIGMATVSRDLRDRKRIEDGLRLLSRTGAAVVDSLDYQRTLHNIAGAFVDGFAAYCLIDVMPPHGRWERTVVHRDPDRIPLLVELSRPHGNHPIARAIEAGESSYTVIDEAWAHNLDSADGLDAKRLDAVRRLRVRSIITVPVLTPAGEIVGALTCALDDVTARENYGPRDLGFVQEVGRRAGAAIANVQLYERERRIALELQKASLPASLPRVDGVVLDAAYQPGSDEAKIGGDWYDAFLLPDKRLVISVGDVLGHGLQAAVSMTKLRLAMQSAAMVNPDPNLMLRVADATLRLSDPDAYATAIAAVYDPAARTVIFASAGHPGPVLRTAAGGVEECVSFGPMVGLRSGGESATGTIRTPPGSVLVFYTDGLVEVVRDIDAGFARLRDALRRDDLLAGDRPAEPIVRAVLGTDKARDDIAVLVLKFR